MKGLILMRYHLQDKAQISPEVIIRMIHSLEATIIMEPGNTQLIKQIITASVQILLRQI